MSLALGFFGQVHCVNPNLSSFQLRGNSFFGASLKVVSPPTMSRLQLTKLEVKAKGGADMNDGFNEMQKIRFNKLKVMLRSLGRLDKEAWEFKHPIYTLRSDNQVLLEDVLGDGQNWKDISIAHPYTLDDSPAVILVSTTELFGVWEGYHVPFFLKNKVVVCFAPTGVDRTRRMQFLAQTMKEMWPYFEPANFLTVANIFFKFEHDQAIILNI